MSDTFTLIVGPQTKGAFALNAYARLHGSALLKQGVKALPLRAASPVLWRIANPDRTLDDRQTVFDAEIAAQPTVLCGLNFFGAPEAALKKGALFPDPAASLAPLGKLAGACQVVLLVDSLPRLFLAPNAARLEAKVKATGWERLFELSWVDLARTITQELPQARLLVLTPGGMALHSESLLRRLFGAKDLPGDPFWLLRQAMSETGQAVLDRMRAQGHPDAKTEADLYTSFGEHPSLEDIEARLGIEKITATLLEQRLAEDLDVIAGLPRTEVL